MTDNSKLTGFDTLSTLRFEGFIERNIYEIEQILLNLAKSDKVQNIKNLYINLHNHIHSTNGHNLDMSEYERNFISQLYEVYRRYGNNGSMEDMLLQVEKHVNISANRDIDAGFNSTKAVTAPQLKKVFNEHIKNPQAHRAIYNALVPRATFTGTPILSVINSINEDHEIDISSVWCNCSGTIVVKYTDTEHPSITGVTDDTIPETVRLYNILYMSGSGYVALYTTNDPDNKYRLYLNIDSTTLEIPRYTELGKDTIVISYNDRLMRIATTKEITDIPLRAPLNINTIDTGVDRVQVSRFVYYNQSADSDEIRFLLN
jgi:hypothetical protein